MEERLYFPMKINMRRENESLKRSCRGFEVADKTTGSRVSTTEHEREKLCFSYSQPSKVSQTVEARRVDKVSL